MQWLLERFAAEPAKAAFIHRDRSVAYGEVIERVEEFGATLRRSGVEPRQLVTVIGDYSPELFCMMLALAIGGNIVIPLTRTSVIEKDSALAICGCDWVVEFDEGGVGFTLEPNRLVADNPLVAELQSEARPGLILFSSGSTGKPKAILHDFNRIADKFIVQRAPTIAIPFLMIDHFGGINTILGIVANLGTVVTVADRSIAAICRAIQEHRVELLPTTPSFLTMLMASNLHRTYDLSSLKRITYGTEVMPQTTLDRVTAEFPGVVLQQTYGLSEIGVMRSQSRPDGSLWVRIGGDGFKTKVIDDVLWIKSDFAMLGYLNAPSNFDADGWFNTQDKVDVDGEYFRILGRTTDLINVGGQKVYPSEIENVILTVDNVADVAVYGEANALLGSIVVARILTERPEAASELKRKVRAACAAVLANYKVPSKVLLADGPLYSARQKKQRG